MPHLRRATTPASSSTTGGDATLEDCDIFGHREAEVAVETEGRLTALRCQIHDGQDSGVFVRDGGQALIQECAVTGNAGAGVAGRARLAAAPSSAAASTGTATSVSAPRAARLAERSERLRPDGKRAPRAAREDEPSDDCVRPRQYSS